MKPEAKAHGLFLEGVKKHGAFDRGLKQVRADGMDAAFLFLQARQCVDHGDWVQFLELHRERISPRTVQFYCQLAENAIEWVRESHPKLKTIHEVHAMARTVVMQSPKPLIALCRELGHLRKFGEYDAVKYATRKIGTQQIEFDFLKLQSSLDVICRLDDPNCHFIMPEGMESDQMWDTLEKKFETGLAKIRAARKQIIET